MRLRKYFILICVLRDHNRLNDQCILSQSSWAFISYAYMIHTPLIPFMSIVCSIVKTTSSLMEPSKFEAGAEPEIYWEGTNLYMKEFLEFVKRHLIRD